MPTDPDELRITDEILGQKTLIRLEEVIARDKISLDITWIKDKSLTDLDNLADPDVLAEEIIENLEAGIESFEEIQLAVGVK